MRDTAPDFSVTPETLRKQVEDRIRQAIVAGYFKPGHHLSERLLCDLFQVSRAVIREAVRQLEAEGLIETLAHRGSFVCAMTAAEAIQVYEVRCVLESLAARTFARNATAAQVVELREAFEEIKRQAAAGNTGNLLVLKHRFYDVMLRGAGNAYVTRMMNQILNRNTLLRATSLSDPERLPKTLREIERLMAAIEARDEGAAWAASQDHVRQAADIAVAKLRRLEQHGAHALEAVAPIRPARAPAPRTEGRGRRTQAGG